MNEKLLQFIWQFQYFNRECLLLESGELLSIIKTGTHNTHQGPDFKDAAIKIDNIELIGNIEIHVLSSDWLKHKHDNDKQYGNVILHVVWQNDVDIKDSHSKKIPVLVLESRVSKLLLNRYKNLIDAIGIPCHNSFLPSLDEFTWIAWKERLLAERLERKALHILDLFHQSNNHWEEVLWWQIASNFGMKVNASLFEAVARTLSVSLLAKHKQQIIQIEALLMGQANLLNKESKDDYTSSLQKEYAYLMKKLQLKPISIQPNFLRMRPPNFPTIRLAQLAVLIQQSIHLFSQIKEMENCSEVKELFNLQASDYWNTHYTFSSTSDFKPKVLGTNAIDNIMINTIIPVLFAYGMYLKDEKYKEKAIKWLSEIKGEDNQIIKSWKTYNQKAITAFDSQALIELTNNYCQQRRCLECVVGNKLLRNVK